VNIDLLDAALGNAERLFASLSAFRKLCGEITDFQEEAKRARADAEAARKSLGDLQAQVMIAQTQLDKLQAERKAAEEKVGALAAEHTGLTDAINQIKLMLKSAA
jgi:chromosome segregation ATPase